MNVGLLRRFEAMRSTLQSPLDVYSAHALYYPCSRPCPCPCSHSRLYLSLRLYFT